MKRKYQTNQPVSDLEALLSIVTGAALEPVSGLAGIAGALLPGQKGQGADWVNKVQELAYQPNDPSSLQAIAGMLQAPMEKYEQGTDWLGEQGEKVAGPIGGTIAKTLPEIAGAGFGIKQMMKAPVKQATARHPVMDAPEADTDMSRRNFIKNAGLLGAGAVATKAVPMKSLLGDTPVAKTAATSIAKALPQIGKADFNAASFFSRNPELIKAIKAGEYTEIDGTDYIQVRNKDSGTGEEVDFDDLAYTGPRPSDDVLNLAEAGDFELDLKSITRNETHNPNALYESVMDRVPEDGIMFSETRQSGADRSEYIYQGVDDLVDTVSYEHPINYIADLFYFGDPDTGAFLHPSDLKDNLERLSEKMPRDKTLKELSEMSNNEALKAVTATHHNNMSGLDEVEFEGFIN